MAVKIHVIVFWVIISYSLAAEPNVFGETYSLHL
jgi:hypothetical protein